MQEGKRRQHVGKRRQLYQSSAKEQIKVLKTSMKHIILAKIRQQVVQFDEAHAVVQYHNPVTSSKISAHIQALWRAIMVVEQAMELDDVEVVEVEPIEQRYSNKSATSSLSTLSTRPSIDAYETDFAVSELDSGYHSFIIL
jgi:hypothetical protein